MSGHLKMTKEKIGGDNDNKGLDNLLKGGVGAIGNLGGNLIKGKPFFEIKKGILYQYEKNGSRRALDRFVLSDVSTID
jgi:hypothetical protein